MVAALRHAGQARTEAQRAGGEAYRLLTDSDVAELEDQFAAPGRGSVLGS